MGAVIPHLAAGQPQEGQPDSSTWPREGSASPVASPTGRGLDSPRAPPKTLAKGKRRTPPAASVRRAAAIKRAADMTTGGGRPKRRSGSEERQRTRLAQIRLEPAEMDKLQELASASGLAVGAYLRACGLKSAGLRSQRRPPVDRELLARANADLNRVHNNINQIARALNIGLDSPHPVAQAMRELGATLTAIRRAAGYDSQG